MTKGDKVSVQIIEVILEVSNYFMSPFLAQMNTESIAKRQNPYCSRFLQLIFNGQWSPILQSFY